MSASPTFDELAALWQEGARRIRAAERADQRAIERVVEALVQELRHRLGGKFTTDELARLYVEQGIDWCFDIATRVAPDTPAAWDLATISGAAFARYARAASDYGGGRRRGEDLPPQPV